MKQGFWPHQLSSKTNECQISLYREMQRTVWHLHVLVRVVIAFAKSLGCHLEVLWQQYYLNEVGVVSLISWQKKRFLKSDSSTFIIYLWEWSPVRCSHSSLAGYLEAFHVCVRDSKNTACGENLSFLRLSFCSWLSPDQKPVDSDLEFSRHRMRAALDLEPTVNQEQQRPPTAGERRSWRKLDGAALRVGLV